MLRRRLAAPWILPVGTSPIERGALLIGSDGRIEAIGPDPSVPRPADVPEEVLERAVILPGLINTHTHLELTGFEGRIAEPEFPKWILRLRELKATRSADQYLAAARAGIQSCYAAGITTVADTGDSGSVVQAMAECGASGIAYQEVFGLHPDDAEPNLVRLQSRVEQLRRLAGSRLRIGVSPHAPYTVSAKLYRAVAEWARAEQLPVAVHIAESAAESQFVHDGTGAFAESWRARGIPLPDSRGRSPVEWLAEHGVLSSRTLCIHAVQVTRSDVDLLASSDAAVAHCPLSNRAHGHGDAPLQQFLDAGLRVGIGTDSVASVGKLDLLAEARAAGRLAPALDADGLLELCTLAGARALGMEDEIGSLAPGKWADCVVLRLDSREMTSPAAAVLASGPEDVMRTYSAGREVYRST